uniref:Death inducer-obliterator 1 n=1 Tax=Petromyzon marinus TaxID=7757 RepID=S4RF74_PETMA
VEEEGDNTEDEKKAKELRKTWGFRRSTLAQRDGESLSDSQEEKPMTRGRSSFTLQIMPRRSGRSTKRSPHVQAFLAPKSRSKKSSGSPANSGSSSPTSSRSTAGSPVKESKDKIDLSSDSKGSSRCDKDTVMKEEDSALKPMCGSSEDDLPLKELQERLRKKKLEQQQMEARLGAVVEKSKVTSENSTPVADDNKVNDVKHQNKSENEGLQDVAIVAAEDANTDDKNQSLGCTGNLLDHDYAFQKRTGCICGKNNFDRVQVLCKQCEEWIHGSCVGLTVELALELEKDNKVYLCPRCCPMESDDEDPHTKAKDPEPAAKDPEPAEKQSEPATTESERSAKVSEPAEKETQPAPHEPEPASVSQKCVVVECSNNALAGSVYCSNECILKHAAAALQSMRKDGAKQQVKGKDAVKGKGGKGKRKVCSTSPGIRARRSTKKRPSPDFGPQELTRVPHRYILAQKSKAGKIAKKSVAAASKDSKQAKESLPTDKGKGNPQASVTRTASEERSQEHSAAEVAKAAAKVDALKHTVKPGMKPVVKHEMGKTVVKQEASKTVLKHEVAKTIFRPDKSVAGTPGIKMEKPTAASTAPKIEKAAVASTSSSHQALPRSVCFFGSVSKEKILHKETVGPSGSHPASSHQKNHPSVEQIRQNVRRTLKDILAKRCSDSDDLTVAEEELVKVAGRIEKELFLLFQATDSRYKGKVRGLILNLKDPKNQGLFRRVLVGDMTAPRLVRLSPEELASRELALWRERDSSKMMKRESWESERRHRHKVEVDMEESPPHPDSEEAEESIPEGCKAETAKADIMSSMLTDTTDQHKAHLFDLNCKICTGKVISIKLHPVPKTKKMATSGWKKMVIKKHSGRMPPPSEETTAKKVKFSLPTASSASPTKRTDSTLDRPTTHSLAEPTPIADVSSPIATPTSQVSTQAMQDSPEEPAEPVAVPAAVSGGTPESSSASPTSVAFTAAPLPASAAEVIKEERSASPEPVKSPPIISVPVTTNAQTKQNEQDCIKGDANKNNARLDSLWKGFINMHGVAKVVAKAYPVSGSMANVAEELPDTIHVGGRILAKMVWDYVGKLKSSASKEVCIIRFHPATEEEAVAYISLYSYFNSRKRYGVVGNASRSLKDMYLIPLAAQDPIPHQLLPFDGPGLEPSRSHMLLGLVIKQKSKRRHQGDSSEGGAEYEKSSRNSPEEKKGKYSYDTGESSYSQRRESKKHRHKYEDTNFGTTPPDFPPPPPPPPPPVAQSNLLTKLFSDKASERPTTSASQQPMMKPLEHILKTLFGNKELPKETSKEPAFSALGSSSLPFSTKAGGFDSIIQHFSGAADVKKLNDDRPYDPEDAYDPEDETIFDEKKRVSGLGNPESLFNSGELQKHLPGEQDIAPKIKETAAPQSYLMASRDPRQAANRNQLGSSIPLPIFQIQEAVKPDVGKSSESSNFDVKSVVEAKPQELQVDLNFPAVSLEVTDKVDTPVEEVSTPEASEMTETVSEPKAIEESSPAVEDTTIEHQKDPEATDEMSTAEVPQDTEPIINASSNEQEDATPESGKSEQKMDAQSIPSFISDAPQNIQSISTFHRAVLPQQSNSEDDIGLSSCDPETSMTESLYEEDNSSRNLSLADRHPSGLLIPIPDVSRDAPPPVSLVGPPLTIHGQQRSVPPPLHLLRPPPPGHPSGMPHNVPPPGHPLGPPPGHMGLPPHGPPPTHPIVPPPNMIGHPPNMPPHLGPPPGHVGPPPLGPPPGQLLGPPPFNRQGPPTQQGPPNSHPLGPPPGHVSGQPPHAPPLGQLGNLPPVHGQQHGLPVGHHLGPPPSHMAIRPPGPPHSAPYGMPQLGAPPPPGALPPQHFNMLPPRPPVSGHVGVPPTHIRGPPPGHASNPLPVRGPPPGHISGPPPRFPCGPPQEQGPPKIMPDNQPLHIPRSGASTVPPPGFGSVPVSAHHGPLESRNRQIPSGFQPVHQHDKPGQPFPQGPLLQPNLQGPHSRRQTFPREEEEGMPWEKETPEDWERPKGKDREPEADVSKGGGNVSKEEPEKDTEPENEPEKMREKPQERERGRDRDYHEREYYERERDYHERDRDRERDKPRHRERARDRSRSKVRDRRRDRSRSRDRDRRDKSRSREREKVRERDRDRDRDRSRSRERDRHRGRDRSRSRERERDRDRDRDRDRRSRSRERRRDRDREYSRSRSRDRDRDAGR